MIFSYNWLQSFFAKKLPASNKLAEILTLHFAEVEEVKKKGRDPVLNIDVRPNRAGDCFSHLGIAREIAAILNLKLKEKELKVKENGNFKAKDFIDVEVENKNLCPRYTARVITGIKIRSSPKWIQEKLISCGLRPINNIVDATNYVMLETGQPLHAFDEEKLKDKKIIVRFAVKGEKITTLDGEKYDLDKDILVIADAEKPVAIAGIKGGKFPEIDKKTKIVVLESANFNPHVVRNGSRKINLRTDASLRFEHGIDPNLTEIAVNKVAALIQKIAGGKLARGLADIYSQKVLPKTIKLDLNYAKDFLGLEIPQKKIIDILKSLNFGVKTLNKNSLEITVPTGRLDVFIPEDLIEEIGRIYGYEKIPDIFPLASLIPPKRNEEIFWEDIAKNILKEAGFTEVYNYSFISENQEKIFNFKKNELVEIENPLSKEQKYLRPSLLPNLLKNVEKNLNYFSNFKIFELGKTFTGIKNPVGKRMLSGVIANKNIKSPHQNKFGTGQAKDEEFYESKGTIDTLLNKLGISNIWYDDYKPTPAASNEASLPPKGEVRQAFGDVPSGREESKLNVWQAGKCAEIKIDNEEIGFLGEISPKILSDLEIEAKVVVFDIDFEKLQKLASEEHEYRPISRHPAAVRDLAILVPGEIRIEEVLNKIETAGGILLRDTDLFDIYEGEELPEGKKNLAFHLIFQAEDKTLSSKEIDNLIEKIIKTLEEEPDWEVRK